MPVYGYWDIRGYGQFIRLMLKYVGEDYEEKRYPRQVAGKDDMSSWLSEKFTLGLDFPNLPYYMDDKVKLTQSHVIGHYIGRKYGLCAETEKDKTTSEMLQGACNDIFITFFMFCFSPKCHEEKDDTLKQLKIKIKQFEEFLGDRPWFIGSKLTWVDFFLYETLNQTLCCWSDILNEFPRLSAYMKRFEELPAIKTYISSPDFITRPVFPKMWGSKPNNWLTENIKQSLI